jgi:hypothetical protein
VSETIVISAPSGGVWLYCESPPQPSGCTGCKHQRVIGVTWICQRTRQLAYGNRACVDDKYAQREAGCAS